MKKLIWTSFLMLAFLQLRGQYFDSGQDPASIRWNQIITENFQLIFPVPFEKEAQRFANALEQAYEYDIKTLGHSPKKISVILHTYSAIGNAFVAWAPRRAEMYTIPPQDIYPQDWLDQLALHEFRHVVQISKMNQGLTRLLYYLFGEQAVAGVFGLYVPLWFAEGDAVTAETALSRTGRGRIPSFEMEMRTQVTGRKIYSYEKAVFGSYKDFVPDRYKLGYLLVVNGRKRYGAGMWETTLDYVARRPYNPTPFSHGIRTASGMNKWRYYRSTLKELDSLWKKQGTELRYTAFERKNPADKKVYTNYRFPQWLNDTSILALRFGLADVQKFVAFLPGQKEKKIFLPGFFDPVWLSARKDLIVWSEYGFDKRWENRQYYNIISYDVTTGRRRKLTRKKFLFAPALSPDASRIAVVEVTPQNHYSLVILDARTGERLASLPNPANLFLQTPSWSEDGEQIVTVVLTAEGKSIALADPATGKMQIILPFSYRDISQPVKNGEYIYYHGTYSGIDNIYAVHIETRKVYQVTSSVYGAFDPAVSPDGKRLVYADYSPMGFDVVETELHPEQWVPLGEVRDNSVKLYEAIARQEPGIAAFDTTLYRSYPVKRYRKFSHLINLHSWAPVGISGSSLLNPGISLLSQNKLSTLVTTLGYTYNYNERTADFTADVSYRAWYPVIEFSATAGGRGSSYHDTSGIVQEYSWYEKQLSLGVSQPLNFTRGNYSRYVSPSVSLSYIDVSRASNVPEGFQTGKLVTMDYNLDAFRLRKRSVRDVRNPWGQLLTLDYMQAVYSQENVRDMFTASGAFLFPGVLKHHSLKISVVDQWQGRGGYAFTSPVYYMRGYHSRLNNRQFRRFSVDYKFPLLYPDLRIGPVLYLQRVKVNLFYDYGQGLNPTRDFRYRSMGAEVTSDLHLLDFLAPLDLGFRYVYRPSGKISAFEFLYSINFSDI